MENKWINKTLLEISDKINYGYTASAKKTQENNEPKFLRITDIQGGNVDWSKVPYCEIDIKKLNKYKLNYGDIVVARTGNSTGENYLFNSDEKAVFASYLIRYKINKNIAESKFIWYQMRTTKWKNFINNIKGGSAQAGANAKTIGTFECIIPPLPIQKKIAHILSTLDDKIELNRKMNETLEAMAQAIFKSWFVDFDPVHAKARAKTKADLETEAKKLGITPEILELFPSEFEESELGMIPKGWEVKPFSDIAKLDTNSIKPFLYPDKVWKHFSIPAFDSSGYPTLEMGSDIKSNKYVVNKNAILSSKLNPHTPRTWIPNVIEGDLAICSTEFMQFIPHSNISRVYVYLLITSKYFQDGIKSRVTGTTGSRQRAQPKQVAEIKICKPSDELLDLFSKVVQPIIDMQLENVEEIQTLQKTRDTLLPKLLSGELDVSEVKI